MTSPSWRRGTDGVRRRRLLSISHSYGVSFNRRLADELARIDGWDVTAVGPRLFHGEFRSIRLEPADGEACRAVAVRAYLTRHVPLMVYGRELRQLLQQDWDLVHCWEEPFVIAGGQVAHWIRASTLLVYATFQNLPGGYPPPFAWIERRSMSRADGWIAFGRTVEQALAGRPGYERPHRVIPVGVDLDEFKANPASGDAVRRELGWRSAAPPVVGFLGRFVPEKGLRLLMRVLDRLGTPWRALIVGGGPMEAELRAWGGLHGDRVAIVTDVAHGAVPDHLNAMSVLCAPSQTTGRWREQFGRMLIEAFACGVPVIGSDSGEIPFVIGDAGLVVPEADEDAWVEAIGSILEDDARRATLSARGRARAAERFGWSQVAAAHVDFFERLVEARAPDGGRP